MKLKNNIFANVLDWLIQEKKVDDQKDLAVKTGISQNTVSRIMTGKVEPSDDTLRKLNGAFGNIFNMQYLRGESLNMFVDDVAKQKNLEQTIDQSSLVNAALAAKDQSIAQMEFRLKEKDELIKNLQNQLADKSDHIATLKSRIAELRKIIDAHNLSDLSYPFPVGVSESKITT